MKDELSTIISAVSTGMDIADNFFIVGSSKRKIKKILNDGNNELIEDQVAYAIAKKKIRDRHDMTQAASRSVIDSARTCKEHLDDPDLAAKLYGLGDDEYNSFSQYMRDYNSLTDPNRPGKMK